MNTCLNKEEFDLFLDHYLNNIPVEDMEECFLKTQLLNCFNWEDELGLMTYFFTHYLIKRANLGKPISNDQIGLYYELAQCGFFNIEELNRDFIGFLLQHSRSKINESLPQTLSFIMQNYINHTYDSSFCV